MAAPSDCGLPRMHARACFADWYSDPDRLTPELISCSVAIDRCTQSNGCLTVLRGSHLLGRLDHVSAGSQTNADPERVEAVVGAGLEVVPCVIEPGDAVFFHANTLHSSAPNNTADPRWMLVCCFCTRSNQPAKPVNPPPPFFQAWTDDAVSICARKQIDAQRQPARM